MTLAEWMAENRISDETLARDLEIDRSTVSRVRRAKLLPSSALIVAMVKASNGAVDPRTFFETPYPISGEPMSSEQAAE